MEQKLKDAASCLPEAELEFARICGEARLEQGGGKQSVSFRSVRWGLAAAACLVLLIGLGLAGHAYAAEIKEYNAAVTFFAENNLSTEGLTREEIKAIYRDITTKKHTNETLENATQAPDKIPGYEIPQETVGKEEIGEMVHDAMNPSGIRYRVLTVDPDKYYFQKYDGETLLWSVECSEFSFPYYTVVSDGILIYDYHLKDSQALLHKYDFDGNLLWKDQPDNGFKRERIACVVENADGSYAVFSNGYDGENHLCLSLYSPDGERLLYKSNPMQGAPMLAARLGDGYLVKMGTGKLINMDSQGNVSHSHSYEGDDCYYSIQSMIEYNGKVYISAYATPKLAEGERDYDGRKEIARIVQYAHSKCWMDISEEELLAVVRENYTAILLVCDPNSGVPQEFYSVAGSLGNSLSISEDGNLIWRVDNIAEAIYTPITSAYSLVAHCCVYEYTFDESGSLIGQEKTDKVTGFYR